MHELYAGSDLVAFDGRVVEMFTRSPQRWHVVDLQRFELEEGRKGRRQLRVDAGGKGGTSGWEVDEANQARFHEMKQAIDEARARYGLPPL